ncbi:hypothetical protein EJB05_01016 [Eragrostis curvula]|uniref:Uncharacterized protein n=1 Tax=Eragrostis curvula TaxID=38414 RepID=A0A5J9WQU6_9POAL|nr:hypothetical protein EJB05_01016 [Eragrostis curvula]
MCWSSSPSMPASPYFPSGKQESIDGLISSLLCSLLVDLVANRDCRKRKKAYGKAKYLSMQIVDGRCKAASPICVCKLAKQTSKGKSWYLHLDSLETQTRWRFNMLRSV